MSYILTPIVVDLKQVTGVIGSKNKRLVGTLIKNFGDEFEEIDEMAADFADEEDGEGATTVRDALTQMVMGGEYNEEVGFVYGYALEFVCRHFGDFLPNRNWSAMRSEWAHKADKALESAGVAEEALRLSHLMNRGSPVPLPLIEDFPGIGYMTLKEIKAALSAFGEDQLAAVEDKELREALSEVRGWLETCEASGQDLICFYA
jgi:hypothetical protein